MTLLQLRYFIEIVNCGSINEAAKRLYISQPSLSNAIKGLESELGIRVFIRSNKGITLSSEGEEFLAYARQVVEQADLLENRYLSTKPSPQHFSISTQHYAFAVSAFVNLVKDFGKDEYEFTLRETRTHEIIEDVKNLRSEIGILYMNEFNTQVIQKFLREGNLVFTELFQAKPHIFVSASNPLAVKDYVTLDDLKPYPCLTFEQGEYNSFYFSEEILSTLSRAKTIHVSDRATLFNLLIGLNGYTISTGVISKDLNGNDIVSIPLRLAEVISVGYVTHKNVTLSKLGRLYIQSLRETIEREQYELAMSRHAPSYIETTSHPHYASPGGREDSSVT